MKLYTFWYDFYAVKTAIFHLSVWYTYVIQWLINVILAS